jgi:leucine-zipper-like transcriptional regulator 1
MLKIEKPKSISSSLYLTPPSYIEKFQESWCWYELNSHGPVPCPRSLHACVAFENNIYVFGGYDGVNRKNDFYKYNVETNTW